MSIVEVGWLLGWHRLHDTTDRFYTYEGKCMSNSRSTDIFDLLADVMRARQEEWRDQAACKGMAYTGDFDLGGTRFVDLLGALDESFEHGLAALRAVRKTGAKLHIQVHTDFLSPWFVRDGNWRSPRVRMPLLNRWRRGIADEVLPQDMVFEDHGVKVYVDPDSLKLIDGTTVDFVKQGLNEAFRFQNPNVRGECGCGESFRSSPGVSIRVEGGLRSFL
mgnify:CR=1 FL=1